MRRLWPAIPAAVSGGAAYVALFLVRPATAWDEDPWGTAWRRAGLLVQLHVVSKQPMEFVWSRPLREALERPEWKGARIRQYTIHGAKALILELPAAESLTDEAEGTTRHGKRESDYWIQQGRYVLILSTQHRVGFWPVQMPEEMRNRVVKVFMESAENRP